MARRTACPSPVSEARARALRAHARVLDSPVSPPPSPLTVLPPFFAYAAGEEEEELEGLSRDGAGAAGGSGAPHQGSGSGGGDVASEHVVGGSSSVRGSGDEEVDSGVLGGLEGLKAAGGAAATGGFR